MVLYKLKQWRVIANGKTGSTALDHYPDSELIVRIRDYDNNEFWFDALDKTMLEASNLAVIVRHPLTRLQSGLYMLLIKDIVPKIVGLFDPHKILKGAQQPEWWLELLIAWWHWGILDKEDYHIGNWFHHLYHPRMRYKFRVVQLQDLTPFLREQGGPEPDKEFRNGSTVGGIGIRSQISGTYGPEINFRPDAVGLKDFPSDIKEREYEAFKQGLDMFFQHFKGNGLKGYISADVVLYNKMVL